MADSLVVANAIELLGGGVMSAIPQCAGATFRLAPGWDLGTEQPIQDIVSSLVLDGERPFGRRSGNRTITLPIVIQVPGQPYSYAARTLLAAAREVLMQTIDAQQFTLTWTRDGGVPIVFDCFRALPSVIQYELVNDRALVSLIQIQLTALPYGRSDVQNVIPVAAPVPGTPAPPPVPVVLDSFTAIQGAQWQPSSQGVVGAQTAFWNPASYPANQSDGNNVQMVYNGTLPGPVSIVGLTALSHWFGLGSSYYWNLEYKGRTKVYFSYTLIDVNGQTLTFWTTKKVPSSQDPNNPAWAFISAAIPQGSLIFDYFHVVSYQIVCTNRTTCLRWVCAYLDTVTAQPPSVQALPASNRGMLYTLYNVIGTSHAPVSMQFQQNAAPGTPVTETVSGSYTVPGGTVSLKVEAWGGGGPGASESATGLGGGGGGGEYAQEPSIPVLVGQVIPYAVGIAGAAGAAPSNGQATTFGAATGVQVVANGGGAAAYNSATGGLGGTGSVNSIKFPGGAGRNAAGTVGGGGGSSAGSTAAGVTPTGTGAQVFTSSTTWTCPAGVTQVLVTMLGAGGGGAGASSAYYGAGAGGGGEYASQLLTVVPGRVYTVTVGSAGAGGAAGNNGNGGSAGGLSSFAGTGITTITAHGGGGGGVNSYNYGGQPGVGGAGGSGSGASTHYTGGAGAQGYPYGGGGGSSAGQAANGNTGSGYGSGATAPTGGGPGGSGQTGNGAGSAPGSGYGGGGGGSYNQNYAGGNGYQGVVTLSYPGGGLPTAAGATAPAGGGNGGAGGGSSNTAGSAGSAPGGGGGGADSAGSAVAGGAGGAGQLKITPFASPAFKTLVVHRPGPEAPSMLVPYVGVGNGTGTPNGATEYSVPSLVAGVNAVFGGTYSILLANYTWNNVSASRTITVTVKQYEYSGGPAYSYPVSVTLVPNAVPGTGQLVTVGNLTLPGKDIAPDNQGGYFTVTVTDTNTSDRFLDILFIDVTGQTVVISEPTTGYVNYYIDEPDSDRDLGRVLGSQYGRPDAISVTDAVIAWSGGPITVEPGNNLLLVYCLEGAPSLSVSYFPRWFLDRLV
jgi:hypothetical protein